MAEKQDKYDLVTIIPGLVIGPTLSGRGTASYDFIKAILGGKGRPVVARFISKSIPTDCSMDAITTAHTVVLRVVMSPATSMI